MSERRKIADRRAVGYLIVVALAVFCPVIAYGQADPWRVPVLRNVEVQLPKLARALVVDGKLDEWASAACVPIRYRSSISVIAKNRQWDGPSDAGMEAYCAWNSDGLCIAATVTDSDVRNDREDASLWQQDCLEVFVDGRGPQQFLSETYTKGAYQILVGPPTKSRKSRAVVNARDGQIEGIRLAGVRTAHGYAIEMLIPWTAFPEFTPGMGARVGLQFGLDDYDARDGALVQPFQMTFAGIPDVWQNPSRMLCWELADKLEPGPRRHLGPMVSMDTPSMQEVSKPVVLSFDVGQCLAKRAASVKVTAVDAAGVQVVDRKVPFAANAAPWQGSSTATLKWDAKAVADGHYIVRAELLDRAGQSLGYARRSMVLTGKNVRDAIAFVESVDFRRLAAIEPFKAAAYLALGSAVEKTKRGFSLQRLHWLIEGSREMAARIDVLNDGKLDGTHTWLYGLVALTGRPESQVVVEYFNKEVAYVTFSWGSLPIAAVTVTEVPDEAARKARPYRNGTLAIVSGNAVIEATSSCQSVAERAAALVAAGEPVDPAEIDAMRADLAKSLSDGVAPTTASVATEFCVGDLHMHTFHSDGMFSPVQIGLQGMLSFMDFQAVTDHNTIQGAQIGQKLFVRYGFSYPYIVGEEITTPWSHLNAYPLTSFISPELSAYEMAKAAHRQGAVIHWNHPTAVPSEWTTAHLNGEIRRASIDAWEHVPPEYDAWKKAGKLPTLVGSSDTHYGIFGQSGERTIVFTPSPMPEDVAEAVRSGQTVLLGARLPGYLYGPDDLIALVVSALAEGRSLKTAKEERLRRMLKNADLAGILKASPWAPLPDTWDK